MHRRYVIGNASTGGWNVLYTLRITGCVILNISIFSFFEVRIYSRSVLSENILYQKRKKINDN